MDYYRNLEVPYFSQRENKIVYYQYYDQDVIDKNNKIIHKTGDIKYSETKAKNSCNITCLAMILHYFGITTETPDEMMKKVFAPTEEELLSYTKCQKALVSEAYTNGNVFESIEYMQKFAKEFYTVESEVKYWKTFKEIKNDILAGFPALVSVGLLHKFDESFYKEDLESEEGIQNIKNYAYHLYANINLDTVKNTDFDDKKTELEYEIKKIEENLAKGNLTEEEKQQLEKELYFANQKLEQLKECKIKGYQYCLDELRSHGHYIVIRGIDDTGVIINDPWGKPVINTEGKGEYYTIMNGDNIHLTQEDFDKQYFQDGHFWSCLIIKEKRWNFVSRNNDYLVTNDNFLENCRKAEMFEFGGYPIKRSNLWHNGLHFSSKIGNEIYPIGPGQLIAARIVNKDPSGNEPANGSRCFVLIKHQIKDDNNNLKDFFVCYMHLKPINNLEEIKNAGEKTNIKWIDDIIKRTKKVRQIKYGKDNTSFYAETDTEGIKEIGKLPDSSIFFLDSINETEKKIYFYYKIEGEVKKYWVKYSDDILTRSDDSEISENLLEELKSGKVTYFNNKNIDTVDSMIEITNSSPIGFMGEYGGFKDSLKDTLHIEIFSNDIIIDDTSEFKVITKKELSTEIKDFSGMCNRREMISFFEDKKLYGTFDFQFLNQDGIITKNEMIRFYNSQDGAERFQNYIIQHISEWSDKIDWKKAIEKATGVSNRGLIVLLRGENFEDTIDNYINKIYTPYKWFNAECIAAMNTESSLFNKGYATFYHPTRFIKWLNEKKK